MNAPEPQQRAAARDSGEPFVGKSRQVQRPSRGTHLMATTLWLARGFLLWCEGRLVTAPVSAVISSIDPWDAG